MRRQSALHLLFAVLIGAIFVLPHVVRMATLHTVRSYSPFAVRSPSATVWDESFLYAAEVNYTYQQHRLANDTDAFEHRDEPVPYSVLPIEAVALLAHLFRSVAAAQIFCHFFFPAIAAWLLMGLFLQMDASAIWAALLALVTLVASFSSRTLEIGEVELLRHGLHSGFIQTLQASRNPNPNISFPLFLGALLAQTTALLRRSTGYALLAGVLGGLLFYSYVYYAIAWATAIAVLTTAALVRDRIRLKPNLISLIATVCLTLPFLLWARAAKKAGGYLFRTNRLGMIHTHMPTAPGMKLSAALGIFLALLWVAWRSLSARRQRAGKPELLFADIAVTVFGCAAVGGILGMSLQVVTGYNVQAENHFPHMVIQPTLTVLALMVLAAVTAGWRRRSGVWGGVLLVLFAGMCVANQVEAAVNSAPWHRMPSSQRALFGWLAQNTKPGSVVATTSLELAAALPVYSHDYTLLVNGSRTSASDSEILERFLVASALAQTPPEKVASELAPTDPGLGRMDPGVHVSDYPAFFFEHSPDLLTARAVTLPVARASLAAYVSLDLPAELKRFRVDYVYLEKGQSAEKITAMGWRKVFANGDGSLWRRGDGA